MRNFIFKCLISIGVFLIAFCGVATNQISTEDMVFAASVEDKPVREMDHFKSSKSWGTNIDMWCINGVVVLMNDKGFMLQLFDIPVSTNQPAQPMKCK